MTSYEQAKSLEALVDVSVLGDGVTANRLVTKLGGFKWCGRCGGSGKWHCVTTYGRACLKCGGQGLMNYRRTIPEVKELLADAKMVAKTVASIKKADATAAAKRDAKYAEELRKRNLKREECLASLGDLREDFLKAIEPDSLEEVDVYGSKHWKFENDFIRQISEQFAFNGWVSERQAAAVIKARVRDAEKKVLSENLPEVLPGERIQCVGVVKKLERYYDDSVWPVRSGTKVGIRGADGRWYSLKTNAERLLEVFKTAEEAQSNVKIDAPVKWVSPDKAVVVLSSRGAKVSM